MPVSIHTLSCEDALEFVLEAGWGFAEVDAEGKFIWVNPAFCKILNAPVDLILGKKYEDWTDPEDREICKLMLAQVLQGSTPSFTLSKRYVQRGSTPQNRRIIWGMLSVAGKWRKETNEFLGYRLQFQPYSSDLTERKAEVNWERISKAVKWSIENWKTIATILAVSISLILGGSEKLSQLLKEAKQVKDSVDTLSQP